MSRNDFLQLGGDLNGFNTVKSKDALPGITPKILWDLWDITVKFGRLVYESAMIYLYPGLVIELGMCGGGNFMAVKSNKFGLKGRSTLNLANGVRVAWDRELSVSSVTQTITIIDQTAMLSGAKINNSRVFMFGKKEMQTEIGQQALRERRSLIIVESDSDVQKVISFLDCPEELAVIDFGPLKVICLQSDKETIITGVEEVFRLTFPKVVLGGTSDLEWRMTGRDN